MNYSSNLDNVIKTTQDIFPWFIIFIEVLKIVISLYSLKRAWLLLKGKITYYLISQLILSFIQIIVSSMIILREPTENE